MNYLALMIDFHNLQEKKLFTLYLEFFLRQASHKARGLLKRYPVNRGCLIHREKHTHFIFPDANADPLTCSSEDMDNEKNVNTSMLNDSIIMPAGVKQTGGRDDLLTRRLKNRERQRRYRARKRHEIDLKKGSSAGTQSTPIQHQVYTEHQSTPLLVKASQIVTGPDFVARVHCKRDWKRDARRAHLNMEQEIRINSPTNSGVILEMNNGVQAIVPVPEDNTTPRSVPSRRNWKAEARNKKI